MVNLVISSAAINGISLDSLDNLSIDDLSIYTQTNTKITATLSGFAVTL